MACTCLADGLKLWLTVVLLSSLVWRQTSHMANYRRQQVNNLTWGGFLTISTRRAAAAAAAPTTPAATATQGPTSIARRRRNVGSPSATGLCPSRSSGKEEMQSAACSPSPPRLPAAASTELLAPAPPVPLPAPLVPPPTAPAAAPPPRENFIMKYSSRRADFSSSSFAASCVERRRDKAA